MLFVNGKLYRQPVIFCQILSSDRCAVKIDLIYMRHNKMLKVYPVEKSKIGFYDLTLVMQGTLTYCINRRKIVVEKNQAILLPPQTVRQRSGGEKSDFISFNFFCDEIVNLPLHIKNAFSPEIAAFVSACEALGGFYDPLQKRIAENAVEAIILCIMRNAEHVKLSELTRKTLEYLHNHYDERHDMSDVCNAISYSVAHLSRVFKKETGKSVMQYALDLKIEKAKALLTENELSLTEIATRLGYDDYNYFTHAFKNRVGVSPLNYQKNLND